MSAFEAQAAADDVDDSDDLVAQQYISLSDLALSADAVARLTKLKHYSDCTLILDDAQIPCHRLKLFEASNVLGILLQHARDDRQCTCRLPGECAIDVAPILELAYGGATFGVSVDNLESVLRCHDKFDCPDLLKAAEAFAGWAKDQVAFGVVITVFRASARYQHKIGTMIDSYKDCGTTLAKSLPMLERSPDPEIIAGMQTLEPMDVQFLENRRRELLESFLVDISAACKIVPQQNSRSMNACGIVVFVPRSLTGTQFQECYRETDTVQEALRQAGERVSIALQDKISSHELGDLKLSNMGIEQFGCDIQSI